MRMRITNIAFFSVVLIILYINVFCLDLNYSVETHKSSFVAWNKTNYRIPYHPSLIIIGSVNGDDKRRDSFYWSRCIPCNGF